MIPISIDCIKYEVDHIWLPTLPARMREHPRCRKHFHLVCCRTHSSNQVIFPHQISYSFQQCTITMVWASKGALVNSTMTKTIYPKTEEYHEIYYARKTFDEIQTVRNELRGTQSGVGSWKNTFFCVFHMQGNLRSFPPTLPSTGTEPQR